MTSQTASPLRIGTRASKLALWQADHVAGLIERLPGAPTVELVRIKTEGDQIQDVPLSMVEGKGFFTKEIEQALLDHRVDLAVHSLKDLETEMPRGLAVPAVLEREDPRDVLIAPKGIGVDDLAEWAKVGTSSLRRRALLAYWRRDLHIVDLRGNVTTRVEKYEAGEYDAVVLAAAGVKRLGLEEHIGSYLSPDRMYPAVSQGAVAVQAREDDEPTVGWLRPLDHGDTRVAVTAERALMRKLQGGCQVPVGALATVESGSLKIQAAICSLDGSRVVEGSEEGTPDRAEQLGALLAQSLLERGGAAILEGIRKQGG